MSLCWNAPARLGDFVHLQGGSGQSLVEENLGLGDIGTAMCRDGISQAHDLSFPFGHYGGGSMGNYLPFASRIQVASADDVPFLLKGGELVLGSEDAISENSGQGFAIVPGALGKSEQPDTAVAVEECHDDENSHDMDLHQFLALLNEPLEDNDRACLSPGQGTMQAEGNFLEDVRSPPLASGASWELSLGGISEADNSGILLDTSSCHLPGTDMSMTSGFGSIDGSNLCHELSLTSQVSPVRQGIVDYSRLRQTDESVLVSDLEQVTTSSPSDYMNEPAVSHSEDDCVFISDSHPAASSASAQTMGSRWSSKELFGANQSRVVFDLTDADSSDGEVCDERDGGYRAEQHIGKRKLPGWPEPDTKRSRVALQPFGSNYLKSYGSQRVDGQPVDLSKVKTEAPAPQVWQSLKAVATVPTDLLNKQILAAGQSVRHPASSRLHDAQVRTFPSDSLKSLNEQPAGYDTGLRRTLPSSLLAPPPGAVPGQFTGLTSRSGSTNSVISRVSTVQSTVCEDEAARGVLRGFVDGAHIEESLDEGLMNVPLLKHQRIALGWMVQRENVQRKTANVDLPVGGILADDQGLGKTISMISLILKLRSPGRRHSLETAELPEPERTTVHLEDEDDVKCLPSQRAGQCEVQTGAKAGVGSQRLKGQGSCALSKTRSAGGTLVVCPTSVLRQWANELRSKVSAEAGLSFVVYHGSSRIRDPEELAKFDVVLTTYCILSMEVPLQPSAEEQEEEKRNLADYGLSHFNQPKAPKKSDKAKKKSKKGGEGQDSMALDAASGPLARVAWFRVILDEAQSIKNGKTQVARAAWGLRAKRRWCLSGTPIQNSIDDLYSYFRFLRYAPYDKFNNFRAEIKDPIARNPSQGYLNLQTILRDVLLRRTKATRIDGEPIVNLPPRIVQLCQAEFNVEERTFYTCLENESRRQFQVYAAAGTVQNNYVNILWMLLRLRQACDHRQLVKGLSSHTPQQSAIDAVHKLPVEERRRLLALVETNVSICTICNDALEEAVVTACAHVFCEQCISQHLGAADDATCPFPKCRKALRSSQLYPLATLSGQAARTLDEDVGMDGSLLPPSFECGQGWVSSSKIDAVIETLLALPKLPVDGAETRNVGPDMVSPGRDVKDEVTSPSNNNKEATEKAIVFSQWTSMLDLLEIPLKKAGFCYRRLDGTMTVNARDRAVHEFNTFPEVNVIIMSLKAASLGLNMVSASHVLLMDVWWNPTTEDQAIDRAHRIGQIRTVRVSRFTVKNTIEDRILALQDRKRQMVASAFGETELGDQRTRLTEQDLRYLFRV